MLAEARAELHLPAEPIAPTLARAGVRTASRDLPAETAADLALLVTEVVTNAVRHAPRSAVDEVVVRIVTDDRIRVEVLDPAPPFEPPTPGGPYEDRPSGWGLFLLDRLASAWGIEPSGGGKKVWFELDPAR